VTSPAAFGLVGGGWRAQYFLQLAARLPEQLRVAGVVVRRPELAEAVAKRWQVPVYLTVSALVGHEHPTFVLSGVPRSANPDVVATLVDRGVPVLSETPPAADLDQLRGLWDRVGGDRLVQVAEQYPRYPGHAARRELVRRGLVGEPTSVQVSSTHDYHAMAIIRSILDVSFAPCAVSASRFVAPLLDPLSREGWTDDTTPKKATTTLATIDFGGERMGLYDFTDNQWHNQLRSRRIVIRGSAGEIDGDHVVRLVGPRNLVRSPLVRHQLGYDLDLDGYDTDRLTFEGQVVYQNAFLGARLADEEIALTTLLTAMAVWCADEGPPPYPLAQGCQDHLISLAVVESATAGRVITTDEEPWHQSVSS